MTTPAPLRSRADVVTDAPARYAKQLVSHLGRKEPFATDGATSTVQWATATASVVVGDGVLTLLAEAPDEHGVALVEDVLGRHLERFAARDALVVDWRRSTSEGGR